MLVMFVTTERRVVGFCERYLWWYNLVVDYCLCSYNLESVVVVVVVVGGVGLLFWRSAPIFAVCCNNNCDNNNVNSYSTVLPLD